MTAMHVGSVVRRDRRIVALSLVGVTILAWLYLVRASADMDSAMARGISWDAPRLLLTFWMWVVMMVGMMLPSASPMILMFARINRDHRGGSEPFVPTAVFTAGYVAVWAFFSLTATMLQWGLSSSELLSPALTSTSAGFNAAVLIAAGLYQWTPLKHACLRHCQTPLGFLMTRWRDGAMGGFRMGLAHGVYCVGCCWVLMALLFVGGVMNLLWVAALAGFVLAEKIAPPNLWLPRLAGATLIAWGGWLAALSL